MGLMDGFRNRRAGRRIRKNPTLWLPYGGDASGRVLELAGRWSPDARVGDDGTIDTGEQRLTGPVEVTQDIAAAAGIDQQPGLAYVGTDKLGLGRIVLLVMGVARRIDGARARIPDSVWDLVPEPTNRDGWQEKMRVYIPRDVPAGEVRAAVEPLVPGVADHADMVRDAARETTGGSRANDAPSLAGEDVVLKSEQAEFTLSSERFRPLRGGDDFDDTPVMRYLLPKADMITVCDIGPFTEGAADPEARRRRFDVALRLAEETGGWLADGLDFPTAATDRELLT